MHDLIAEVKFRCRFKHDHKLDIIATVEHQKPIVYENVTTEKAADLMFQFCESGCNAKRIQLAQNQYKKG